MINDKLRAPQVINQGSTLQRSTLTKLYVNKLESKLEQLQQSVLALGAILLSLRPQDPGQEKRRMPPPPQAV